MKRRPSAKEIAEVAAAAEWTAAKINLMANRKRADPKGIRVYNESPYARHERLQIEVDAARKRDALHGVKLSWAECKMKLGSEQFFRLLGLSLKKGELVR